MILIDNTQVILSTIFTQPNALNLDENMVRHIVLNTYRMYRSKFGAKYGEIVLCQDAGESWRKGVFPLYKNNRKKTRDGDKEKWDSIFSVLSTIRDEVSHTFPYKHMRIQRCEADDIIAVLCKNFHKQEPILIVSSDKDFNQLQRYPNVRQYSPTTKTLVDCKDPLGFLQEHIIRGDSGDGVPNVLSEDDSLANEEKRQKPITAKRFAELMASGESDMFMDDEVRKNWQRNTTLIDLTKIPAEVEESILNRWSEPSEITDRSRLIPYFMKHKLKTLMESIHEF